MKTRIIAFVGIGMFIFSCAPKVVTPVVKITETKNGSAINKNDATETVTTIMTAELAEGKNLFENNCAKCHKLFNPSDYSAEQWTPIVLRMQEKAKIQDVEREKIYNYLTMK